MRVVLTNAAKANLIEIGEFKLEQLRQDIRNGVESGPSTLWDVEEIKREGRQRRAARAISGRDRDGSPP